MDGQRQLVVTLATTITIPPGDLQFNTLIAAFNQFGELSIGQLFETCLDQLEQRVGQELVAAHPGRFVWYGRQGSRPKKWVLPFGPVKHHYRRMLDRKQNWLFCPLREALEIPKHRRLTWPVLAGPVGLASELSFRRATAEAFRLQGIGPAKSTTWAYFQAFAEGGLEPLLPPRQRTLEVVVADGTKLKQQHEGFNVGQMDLRIVLSTQRDGGRLQVAAFGLDDAWPTLKERLRRDFPGHQVDSLITDGEEAIEVLADARTRLQRCLVHGPRGFAFALYADGYKKPQQRPYLELFGDVRAWQMDAAALAGLASQSRYRLLGLTDQAKTTADQILDLLPKRATTARSYIQRYVQPSLSYLRALLNGESPLPAVTTNQAENAFSRMDLRLKRIGRRWSLEGALNMIRVLLTKAFRGDHWREYLGALTSSPGAVSIETKILDQRWAM